MFHFAKQYSVFKCFVSALISLSSDSVFYRADVVAFDFLGHGDSPSPNQSNLYTEKEVHELQYSYLPFILFLAPTRSSRDLHEVQEGEQLHSGSLLWCHTHTAPDEDIEREWTDIMCEGPDIIGHRAQYSCVANISNETTSWISR